jgi:hypothetical protein
LSFSLNTTLRGDVKSGFILVSQLLSWKRKESMYRLTFLAETEGATTAEALKLFGVALEHASAMTASYATPKPFFDLDLKALQAWVHSLSPDALTTL